MNEDEPGIPQWDLADRMRKALREASLGVADMADYLDVSRGSISNWINGRVEPSTQTLRLWALKSGVRYDWLAGDREGRDARRRLAAGYSSRPTLTTSPAVTFRHVVISRAIARLAA